MLEKHILPNCGRVCAYHTYMYMYFGLLTSVGQLVAWIYGSLYANYVLKGLTISRLQPYREKLVT